MAKPIYLDNQATTPLDPRVFEAMTPYFLERFGNPHSSSHRYGWEASAAIDVARDHIADLIVADASEIIFTSGATESNNLALKGVMRAMKARKNHLVTVATEHKCVLESAAALTREGVEVTLLPVKPSGLIELDALREAITEKTALVSVMAVNNEIGVIQPLSEVARICHERGALLHSDAAQGFAKIDLNMEMLEVDLMSLSGHKIYGPKGIGALYVRRDLPVRLVPHMDGGGQEGGIRSGTLAPALCVGMGKAAEVARQEMRQDQARAARQFDMLLEGLRAYVPDLVLNGDREHRLKNNLNISFPGVDGSRLLSGLREVSVSSGAACASAAEGPSYVLDALGVDKKMAESSLRIGTGRFTTDEDIRRAADIIGAHAKTLQAA